TFLRTPPPTRPPDFSDGGSAEEITVHIQKEIADAKLDALRDSEGFESLDEMLGAATFDSVSPGICSRCDYTTSEIEPDQDRGWCESCGQNTVVSALVLAGFI